ncbi:MAG: undecaprenyl/decaprenyl-phosphate alpha-N-acetylglucosaminyl 1-phosphate transferase, partial [Phycisphaerae bacterium]|nr:undecaprenyl/decaprenyl-phosphate alpha-N-acetylglucosaminyl 1-phosphate transferase [Phycisphaerae bacterium]
MNRVLFGLRTGQVVFIRLLGPGRNEDWGWMITYLITYGVATILSLIATVLSIRLARRIGAMDLPGLRKAHTVATPRIGGLAILFSVIAAVLSAMVIDRVIRESFFRDFVQIGGLICVAMFVLGVGLVDDIRGLRARKKLMAELAAAGALCALGVRIESLTVPGLFQIEFGWMSWPITIFWIVGITNAINLIDGLDGLAAGISAITCAAIAVFALQSQNTAVAVLMLAVLGGLTGFLFFNFNPAKVFLGDCGSLFLGFLLAGTSVLSSTKTATAVGLALPMLAMGIPVFDILFSVVRRTIERRSLFAPDCQHIHHRLMEMGLRQKHVVLVLYGVTAVSAALGTFMMVTHDVGTLAVFLCVLLLLGLFLCMVGVLRFKGIPEAVRHMVKRLHERKKVKDIFEEAQLRLREVRSVSSWWRVIYETAERMGAVRLSIIHYDDGGA